MSFCNDLKSNLCSVKLHKRDCPALFYGMAMFGRSFSIERIRIQTQSADVAQLYASLLKTNFKIFADVIAGGSKVPTYRVDVASQGDRLKILADYEFGMTDGYINTDVLDEQGGLQSFLRGAFLSCGQMSDPIKEYRLDFCISRELPAVELQAFLAEIGVVSSITRRQTGYCVYIKRRDSIIDFLAFIGATVQSLNLIDESMLRDVKNSVNRAQNCDNANISRIIEASIEQRRSIEKLIKSGKFNLLSQPLKSAGMLRMEYPEASINELCSYSGESVSQSGMYHRLKSLVILAGMEK